MNICSLKSTHTFRSFLKIFALITSLSFASSAFAIAYPDGDDCSSNDITSCQHPNIVMISGFDSNGLTVALTRCSAAMIQKPSPGSNKYVFLTAGHCTIGWKNAEKPLYLGVSFDPNASANGNAIDISHFVTGTNGSEMIPITSPLIKINGGSEADVGILKYDYGVLVFTFTGSDPIAAKWPAIANIPVAKLAQDVGLSLDNVVANTQNPNKNLLFSAVGYGLTDLVAAPGTGGNAGGNGGDPGFGTKRVALTQSFLNMNNYVIKISQNPARGFNGTCFGDSGGPNYYTDPNLGEILVAVTSQGDAVCRAMGTNARIDIPDAVNFINCVRNASSINQAQACGQ